MGTPETPFSSRIRRATSAPVMPPLVRTSRYFAYVLRTADWAMNPKRMAGSRIHQ
jgi:hypothetical protein